MRRFSWCHLTFKISDHRDGFKFLVQQVKIIDSAGFHRLSCQQLDAQGALHGRALRRGKAEDTLVPDLHFLGVQLFHKAVAGEGNGSLGHPALDSAVNIGDSGLFAGSGQDLPASDIVQGVHDRITAGYQLRSVGSIQKKVLFHRAYL